MMKWVVIGLALIMRTVTATVADTCLRIAHSSPRWCERPRERREAPASRGRSHHRTRPVRGSALFF